MIRMLRAPRVRNVTVRGFQTAIQVFPASASAAREVPTPVAIFNGPFGHPDDTLRKRLCEVGYNVA
jgi:hypothetical protein